MEETDKGTFGNTKRFVICRLGVGNRRGRRRELVDETDLLSQAEALPALLAAEHAKRAGVALRAPAVFSYESLCARTGRIVARHDAGRDVPAWAMEVLGAAGLAA